MQKRSLLLLLAMTAVLPSSAATITSGTWYHIQTRFNDTALASSDGGALFSSPGALPWTFTLLSAGSLDFVDAQFNGDTVEVYNGSITNPANKIGTTPQGAPFDFSNCGQNPEECLADNKFSRVSIALTANTPYDLQFVAIDSPFLESSGFFRINGIIDAGTPPSTPPPTTPSTPPSTTTSTTPSTPPIVQPPFVNVPLNDPSAIPEPSTYALTGTAFIALAWLKSRKR